MAGPPLDQNRPRTWADKHPFLYFAMLAHGISSALWIPAGVFLSPVASQTAHYGGAFGPLSATLILGVVWAVWHAPILLGNHEVMSGALPGRAILAMVGVTLVSITVHAFWYTWLINRTGSVLLCILLHAGYNSANGLLLPVGPEALAGPAYQTLLTLMTLVLIASVAVLFIATRGRLGAA